MRKQDIKRGMVVVMRNGEVYQLNSKNGDLLCKLDNTGTMDLDRNYYENLTNVQTWDTKEQAREWDIVAVYRERTPLEVAHNCISQTHYSLLLWKEEDGRCIEGKTEEKKVVEGVKEMTKNDLMHGMFIVTRNGRKHKVELEKYKILIDTLNGVWTCLGDYNNNLSHEEKQNDIMRVYHQRTFKEIELKLSEDDETLLLWERKEEEKPKMTGWERVKRENVYYLIGSKKVEQSADLTWSVDTETFNKANYFSTKEKAEEINFKQTLFRKLQKFSDEHGAENIDWTNRKTYKYFIYYSFDNKRLEVGNLSRAKHFGQVHFLSKNIALDAVKLYKDDLIKYFTE